jgi:hypothetical protein
MDCSKSVKTAHSSPLPKLSTPRTVPTLRLLQLAILFLTIHCASSIRLAWVTLKTSEEERGVTFGGSYGDDMESRKYGEVFMLSNYHDIIKILLYDRENLKHRPPPIGYEDEEGNYIDGKYKEDVDKEKADKEEKQRQEALNRTNLTAPSTGILGTRKKEKPKEKKLYIRLVYYPRDNQNKAMPVEAHKYLLRGIDPRFDFIQRYNDKNLYAIKQSYVERPFLLILANKLSFSQTFLQLSQDPTFKIVDASVTILHSQITLIEHEKLEPISFIVEHKSTNLSTVAQNSSIKKMIDNTTVFYNDTYSISLKESSFLMIQMMSHYGYQILEDIETTFQTDQLLIKEPALDKIRGRLMTSGAETPQLQFSLYCLKQGQFSFDILIRFVGDLTFNLRFNTTCEKEVDLIWPQNGAIHMPETMHQTGSRIIPLTISKDIGRIVVNGFSSDSLTPIKSVKLIGPQLSNGWWSLEWDKPAYLEFECYPQVSTEASARIGVVSVSLEYHGKTLASQVSVRCDDVEIEKVSAFLKAGVAILCLFITIVALVVARIFYNGVKSLKSTKLQQASLKKKAVGIVRQDV